MMKIALPLAAVATIICLMLFQTFEASFAAKMKACEKNYSHAYCFVKING